MSTIKYNVTNLNRFMSLPINDDQIQLTYVWIDGTGQSLRSKTRTSSINPKSPSDCPEWNFCGSATGFNKGNVATLQLVPRALYNDPFRGGNAKLILCDVYKQDGSPVVANSRFDCAKLMDKVIATHEPWFGIEQEFTLIDGDTDRPLGWPPGNGFPSPQGPYYCGIGAGKAIGRDISEAHYRACLFAGIPIAGTNAEVMPAQWEFQVGPCKGIAIGDDLWMARFILIRIGEEFGVKISFDPKPIAGDWNGAGAHVNFSTKQTRSEGGLDVIKKYIEYLKNHHEESIAVYDPNGGKDNNRRLTGKHDTSNINEFSAGIGDRGASIRIPELVIKEGCGYFEDRRPASNCDPYTVIRSLVVFCLLIDQYN